jgi:hypothetical protein
MPQIVLNGTTGIANATWTTATRPASPVAGQTGYNTDIGAMETYNGSSWSTSDLPATGASGNFLQSNGTAWTSASTLGVSNGGTGVTTLTTAYGVLAAGTTATGALQNMGTGTSGQVLKSNGPGVLPSWGASTPAAGSVTDAMISTIGTGTFNVKNFIGTIQAGNTANVLTFIYGVKIGRNITLQWSGNYTFSFSSTNQTTTGYVYLNGVNQGTLYGPINNGGSGGPFTGSLNAISVSCVYGDVISIYHTTGGNSGTNQLQNVSLLSTANSLPYAWYSNTSSSAF